MARSKKWPKRSSETSVATTLSVAAMKDVHGKKSNNSTRVGPNSIMKILRGTREDRQIALTQDMVEVATDLLPKTMLVIAGNMTDTNSKIRITPSKTSSSSTSFQTMEVLRIVKMVKGADTNRISPSVVTIEVVVEEEVCATIRLPNTSKTLTSSVMMVEAGVGIVKSMI